MAETFLLYIGINVMFIVGAALLVYWGGPIAAGSGVGEVKCFLNGIKVPGVFRCVGGCSFGYRFVRSGRDFEPHGSACG